MYKNGIWVLGFFSKMYMFIYILMGDVGYSPSYPSHHKPPHVLNCLKDLRGKASIVLKYAVSFRSYAMQCYVLFPPKLHTTPLRYRSRSSYSLAASCSMALVGK